MIIERSMHSGWLSNSYLVGDRPGGSAVLIDSGGPVEPLMAAVERHDLSVTHLLLTHADADHVAGNDDYVSKPTACRSPPTSWRPTASAAPT